MATAPRGRRASDAPVTCVRSAHAHPSEGDGEHKGAAGTVDRRSTAEDARIGLKRLHPSFDA